MKSWVAMGEGRGGELGFLTTNERKEEMCLLLRESMKCFRISLHKQFQSITLGTDKAKTRLKDEILNYCVINEAPKTAFGKVGSLTLSLHIKSLGSRCVVFRRLAKRLRESSVAIRTTAPSRCKSVCYRPKSSTRRVSLPCHTHTTRYSRLLSCVYAHRKNATPPTACWTGATMHKSGFGLLKRLPQTHARDLGLLAGSAGARGQCAPASRRRSRGRWNRAM